MYTKLFLLFFVFFYSFIQGEKLILKDNSVIYGKIIRKNKTHLSFQINKKFPKINIPKDFYKYTQKKRIAKSYIKKLLKKKLFALKKEKKPAVIVEYFVRIQNISKKKYALNILQNRPSIASIFLLISLSEEKEYFPLLTKVLQQIAYKNKKLKVYDIIYKSILAPGKIKLSCVQNMKILHKLNRKKTVSLLKHIIQSEKLENKIVAIKILACIDRIKEQDYFLFLLKHDNDSIVSQALFVLGQYGSVNIVPEIIKFLEYEDPKLVFSAHWALKCITQKNYPPTAWIWWKWWKSYEHSL